MPGVVNVGKNAMDVRKSVAMLPYSRVIITVDEDTEYEAGNTSGETLEFECPWGTQQMANDILANIRGYQYQPYTVDTAIVEPSAEIGDAVQANGVYGGMYQQDSTFGSTFYSDFSAPSDEQLDHEFTYVSPTERRITRQKLWSKAEFSITNGAIAAEVSQREADSREFRGNFEVQAREIAARVTQTGGNNSSFGWSLVSNAFTLYSGNKAVFTCNSGGVNVDGNITARSGYIGNGTTGFTIGNTNIRNGMTSLADTTNDGIYLGTDGIALGKGKFKVTKAGALTSTSATITGKVTATSGYIGNGTSGFEIGNTFIRNGVTSMSDASHDGIYLGTNGIRLGKGVFTVSNAGKLTCTNADISGKITATSGSFSGELKSATGTFTGTLSAATGSFSGQINAKSGYIGNGASGFTISNSAIYNGMTSRDDTSHNGVYVGTDGFACGAGRFKVTNAGKLTASDVDITGKISATSGYFDGTIYANRLSFRDRSGNTVTISAANLTDGTISSGKLGNGSVTEGKLGAGSVTGGKIGDGAVTEGKLGDGSVSNGKIQGSTISKNKCNKAANDSWEAGEAAKDKIDDLVEGRINGRFYADLLFVKDGSSFRQAYWVSKTISGTTINYVGRS